MSRWPAMVVVVTVVPAGHLLDPRDNKEVIAPGVVSIANTFASAASKPSSRSSVYFLGAAMTFILTWIESHQTRHGTTVLVLGT